MLAQMNTATREVSTRALNRVCCRCCPSSEMTFRTATISATIDTTPLTRFTATTVAVLNDAPDIQSQSMPNITALDRARTAMGLFNLIHFIAIDMRIDSRRLPQHFVFD